MPAQLNPKSPANHTNITAKVGQHTVHELKSWPAFFDAIAAGAKRHDLRRADDRTFRVGDRLRLREFDPQLGQYTGREQVVEVTYITSAPAPCALSGEALHKDFCILSIALADH